MKPTMKVKVRTPAGLVDAPSYYQWKQVISGLDFVFTLHVASGNTEGFVAPLAISELETGFDTKATIRHPHTGVPLTSANIKTLKKRDVVGVARAALHHLIYRRVGATRFLQAMLGAQMQISKIDLSKYAVDVDTNLGQHNISGTMTETFRNQEALDKLRGGLAEPGVATMTGTATPEQVEALNQMFGSPCETCNGSKVVSTTDKDHEGNNIEITCPACIPKAIQLPETKVSDMVTQPDWGSPTEEEWYEGLEHSNKIEYLQSKLTERQAYSKELSAKATKADYDRIDDIDSECRDIEAKLKALMGDARLLTEADLPSLRHQREQLQLQIDQHGTMTGDTTERDYEDASEQIAELDSMIQALERKPCSN